MKSPAVRWAVASFVVLTWVGAATTRAAVERGTLTIQSEPNVEVRWEGVLLGNTDPSGQMSIGNIPPGTYTLTFTSPGFTTRIESVDVAPGLQHVEAKLVEAEPTEASEPAPPFEAAGPMPAGEGGGDPRDLETSRPRDYKATTTFLVVTAVLVLTAFLLADRHSRRRQTAAKPQGPRIVVQGTSTPPKKLPTFYDDLKRRETDLEKLRDVGSGRSHRQVIDVEVADHGPVEDDR